VGVTWGLAAGAAELLLLFGLAVSRLIKPSSEQPVLVVAWVAFHVLLAWWVCRAAVGWVLRKGDAAAERACARHEQAQATAAFPPGAGSS
jgi:hypothetical protein